MKLLFFDTETTGKAKNINASAENISNWPRVVQLAWQVYDEKLNLIEEHDFIVKPNEFVIPSEASAIHKITTEIAYKFGVELNQVLEKFYNSVNDADLLIAHNFSFDYGVMGSELLRNGFYNILNSKESLCTMKSTTEFCKIPGPYGYKWPTLQELYFVLFNESFNAHNALDDIRATARCFWELEYKKVISFNKKKLLIGEEKSSKNNSEFNLAFEKTIQDKIKVNEFVAKIIEVIFKQQFKKLENNIGKNKSFDNLSNAREVEYFIYNINYVIKALTNNKIKKLNIQIADSKLVFDKNNIILEIKVYLLLFVRKKLLECGKNLSLIEIRNFINYRFEYYQQFDNMFNKEKNCRNNYHVNSEIYFIVILRPLITNFYRTDFGFVAISISSQIDNTVNHSLSKKSKLHDVKNLLDDLGFPKDYFWQHKSPIFIIEKADIEKANFYEI